MSMSGYDVGFDVITPSPSAYAHNRPTALDWDIFCNVIDNYGDIGVCWRLARQLAAEHGFHVRLWVDDLNAFRRICSRGRSDPAGCKRYWKSRFGIGTPTFFRHPPAMS
jgi:hypothetical protein